MASDTLTTPGVSPNGWRPTAVEHLITSERLSSYLATTRGDLGQALELYEWNTHAAGAIVQTAGLVEVIVRNALDREMIGWATRRAGGQTWFDSAPLGVRGSQALADARSRATQNGRVPEVHGKVIAELSFGFWRVLVASRYHASLWVPALHKAFPLGGVDLRQRRVHVERLLREIGDARNRAAHHEPVHERNLAADLRRVITLGSWISHDAEAWIADTTVLSKVITERMELGL